MLLLAVIALAGCVPGWDDSGAVSTEDVDGDGWSTAEGDCDDADRAIGPGAVELCNGIDDDCDGTVDVGAADGPVAWIDADADGFGATRAQAGCEVPEGSVTRGGDCDDADALRNPDADERCNEVDDDCDGSVDEEPLDGLVVHRDADGDGFGRSVGVSSCGISEGWTTDSRDCDDGSSAIHPAAQERCNGYDDDCDGLVDDDDAVEDAASWWPDADGDGYGAGTPRQGCSRVPGEAPVDGDCDDADANRSPGRDELCNEVDDDCDEEVDEEAVDGPVWFLDLDDDGYGDPDNARIGCEAPTRGLAFAGDCDDLERLIFPGADERCNGFDDDCDGAIDEADTDAPVLDRVPSWTDSDGDGWGTGMSELHCAGVAGWALVDGDCDDGDELVAPDRDEVCNNAIDDDCDGSAYPCGPIGVHDWDAGWAAIEHSDAHRELARELVAVPDTDGDGRDDLILTPRAPNWADPSALLWVHSAPTGPVSANPAAVVELAALADPADTWRALGVSAPLDWNGDGVEEVAVGLATLVGGNNYEASVHLLDWDGSTANVGSTKGVWLPGSFPRTPNDLTPVSVLVPWPDADGDGDDELIVAPTRFDGAVPGLLVIPGGTATDASQAIVVSSTSRASAPYSESGVACIIGDIDGDGADDLGVYEGEIGPSQARLSLFVDLFGAAAWDTDDADAHIGIGVSEPHASGCVPGRDLDGSGSIDIALGTPRTEQVSLFTTPPGPSTTLADADATIIGSSNFGSNVAVTTHGTTASLWVVTGSPKGDASDLFRFEAPFAGSLLEDDALFVMSAPYTLGSRLVVGEFDGDVRFEDLAISPEYPRLLGHNRVVLLSGGEL